MNLWDIVKTVGSAVISTAVPGGGAIIDLVNAALPEDKKLPVTATGDQVRGALAGLPPEQQSELMNKQLDVDITQIKEASSSLQAMLLAESNSTHSSRAFIAKGSFLVVAFASSSVILCWSYAVLSANAVLVTAIQDGWPWIAAINGIFVTLLRAYFGILKGESKNRLDAASGAGKPTQGIAGAVSALLNR